MDKLDRKMKTWMFWSVFIAGISIGIAICNIVYLLVGGE